MKAVKDPEVKKNKLTGVALVDTVSTNLMAALGRPSNLLKVRSVNVFDNRWRVDVWTITGESAGIVRAVISDSFFLHVTDEGKIVSPVIEKKYT